MAADATTPSSPPGLHDLVGVEPGTGYLEFILARPLEALVLVLLLLALAGAAYLIAAAVATYRFRRRERPAPAGARPPVTILKPLCGDEPGLRENLLSFCRQRYPRFQVVFGVHRPDDPAAAVVRALMRELLDADFALVVDRRLHGANYKVSNLINMLPQARHDLLVIADSDIAAPPDYLERLVADLADPEVGLVTCLYTARGVGSFWARLGAAFVNHWFLPSALVEHALGTQERAFGATLALRRGALARIGGLEAIKDQLADDHVLGRELQRIGLRVRLAPCIVRTTMAEGSLRALLAHELRWARTIRLLAPYGYAASAVTHPLTPALLATALALAAGSTAVLATALAVLGLVLACRLGTMRWLERELDLDPTPAWLAVLRDLLSTGILIASFFGTTVAWREHSFTVGPDGRMRLARGPHA